MPDQFKEQRILITQASPGMVLSRPVVDQKGLNLCGANSELTDALIQKLTLRGIKRIHVLGNPLPTRSRAPTADQVHDLRRRFHRARDIALMAIIERTIEKELLNR